MIVSNRIERSYCFKNNNIMNIRTNPYELDKYITSTPVVEIHSRAKFPGNILSNFSSTNFELDGIQINSMEGFIQSLKISDKDKQKEICAMSGVEAKKASKNFIRKNADLLLHWNNETFSQGSKKFKEIILRANEERKLSDSDDFYFDGKKINSIDNLILAMRVPDEKLQEEICSMTKSEAEEIVATQKKQYVPRMLYWNGKQFERNSKEYQKLLQRVYTKRFITDKDFRLALLSTKGCELKHTIGKKDVNDTILTEDEFISQLTSVRDSKILSLYLSVVKLKNKIRNLIFPEKN